MKKKYLFLFIALLLIHACGKNKELFSPDTSFPVVGTDSTFDVITWNIRDFPQKGRETIDHLTRIITTFDVDCIALQEIVSNNDLQILTNQLSGWKSYHAQSAAYDKNLAYLYNTKTVNVSDVYEIFTNDSYAFPRPPLVMNCQYNNHEITIINNHFKASSGTENEARRRDASQKIKSYIDTYLNTDEVIVLGDLNDILTDADTHNVFLSILQDTTEYKFVDMPIAQGSSTHWSYPTWPSHLDHILITKELFPEMNSSGSAVKTILIDHYFDEGLGAYIEIISDHRPVILNLHL